MTRSRIWIGLLGVTACNVRGPTGAAGGSNEVRAPAVASVEATRVDAAPPIGLAPTATATASAPSAATPSATPEPAASARGASSLVSLCPQKFSLPRYANCKWSTGMYRYCGGAAPVDNDQPREGCVCNECFEDKDCNKGQAGRCVAFPDEACGPPAKGCVYAGDACAKSSGCKPPERCQHDKLGHPSCSPPPVPHM